MTIRSDTIANVALTVMCLLVSGAVVERFLLPKLSTESPGTAALRSDEAFADLIGRLAVPNSKATAVIVVSSRCRFCTDSVEFYQRLVALRNESGFSGFATVFVGLLDEQDASAFVKANQLPMDDVRPTPQDLRVKVRGTPTLIVLNGSGRIVGSWAGKLAAARETNVITTIATVVRK